MRNGFRTWLAVGAAAAGLTLGCSTVPPCTISPVEIEELREDAKVLERNLAEAKERAGTLAADLAAKQANLQSKQGKPEELRRRLDALRRGSGIVEKPKESNQKSSKESS